MNNEKVNIIPFGEVDPERFELSKEYELIEQIAGFWRLTRKCKDNYNSEDYILYLQGKIEKEQVRKLKSLKRNVIIESLIKL